MPRVDRGFGVFYGHLVYFMAIWYILWQFGIFYGHLEHFMTIWYILWPIGIFYGYLVYFLAIWYILWQFGIFYGHLVHFMTIWYILWPVWYILWQFGIFYGHLEHFMTIWYILWPFGIWYGIWYIFPHFYVVPRKIWQVWCTASWCASSEGILGFFNWEIEFILLFTFFLVNPRVSYLLQSSLGSVRLLVGKLQLQFHDTVVIKRFVIMDDNIFF
jgi:hypothetical protein